jgi:uncharacterized Fe-S center protein
MAANFYHFINRSTDLKEKCDKKIKKAKLLNENSDDFINLKKDFNSYGCSGTIKGKDHETFLGNVSRKVKGLTSRMTSRMTNRGGKRGRKTRKHRTRRHRR